MPRLRFKDLPIAAKSLVAPLVGAMITAAIVVVVVLANNAVIRSEDQADAAEQRATVITAARMQFTQGHAALFRAVSWRANNVDANRIAAARKEAMDAITRARDLMQHLSVPESSQAKLDALRQLVAGYKEAAQQTVEVMQDDAFSAMMLMNDAHERSLRAAEAFGEVSNEIAAQSAELRASASEALRQGSHLIMAVASGGIVLALALAFVPARLISRPVTQLAEAVSRIAAGDLDTPVPNDDRADEIGAMGRSVIVLKHNTEQMRRLEAEQVRSKELAAATRKADMNRLADSFEKEVGQIVSAVSSSATGLEAAAATLIRTAETTRHLTANVASASEHASSNVQSVASASEELAGSVHEIARQVQESSVIAGQAVEQAQRDARINELSRAASRIGDVVKLITEIAEQTNLLALNATIEAARAGEAGRGFAVVAQEVKALAAQTAKATGEIGTQIAGMQTATGESVAAIKEIDVTIRRISEIAAAIAAAVEEQGAATQEISRNIQQAATGSAEVAESIGDVNKGAAATGSASTQVHSSARSLSSEGNRLKCEVEKFLTTVRAA